MVRRPPNVISESAERLTGYRINALRTEIEMFVRYRDAVDAAIEAHERKNKEVAEHDG
jgi:hypothetical protein